MAKKKNTERIGVKCAKCGEYSWADVEVDVTVTDIELRTRVSEAPKWKS